MEHEKVKGNFDREEGPLFLDLMECVFHRCSIRLRRPGDGLWNIRRLIESLLVCDVEKVKPPEVRAARGWRDVPVRATKRGFQESHLSETIQRAY
ncbi:MAG: hypothetical protein BWY06_03088 [Candidatus Latescibacteria bacterium ADurb.Bin168]|nr:MAG: hypothetical protein BWY06_03088 [Candidatus Latescibacteria bacterium ADurb.Bin168]